MADLANLKISVDSRAVKTAQNDLNSLGRAAGNAEKNTNGLSNAFGSLKGILGGLGLALAVREFIVMADSIKLLEARIKNVTPAAEDYLAIQKQLVGISKQNQIDLNATAGLYAKISRPIRSLGGDTKTVVNITKAFGQALKIGGASAQEASAATMQFAQAMASGVLRGDEFNSIAEASPRILQAIAEGSGIAEGALREMAAQGKLTAGVVGGALLVQMGQLNQEAAKIPQTVGGAFTNFKTDLALVANELNNSAGLTTALVGLFGALSGIIRTVGTVAVSSITAMSTFLRDNKEAVSALTTAMVLLGGAIGGLLIAYAVGAAFTTLVSTLTALAGATLAARVGFVAMAATMGTLPAVFAAVRTAALALYASLGPIGWAMAAIGAAAAYLTVQYYKQESASNSLLATEKAKAAALKEQKDAAAEAAKQAAVLQKNAEAQAAKAAAAAKKEADAAKARNEALAQQKALKERIKGFDTNIEDLQKELDLILQGTVAEEARMRVQMARQGASKVQIEETLRLTRLLTAEEEKRTKAKEAETKAIEDAKKATQDAIEAFKSLTFNIDLEGVFGNFGKAMGASINAFDKLIDRQEKYNELIKSGKLEGAALTAAQQKNARLQVNSYANLIGSAKGFFKEGSKGYKALQAAETAFRMVEIALAAKAAAAKISAWIAEAATHTATKAVEVSTTVAAEAAKTGATVAGTATRTPLKIAEGAASMFASLGPLGFAAVAAMLAVMASLGFFGGGSSKPPATNSGTGTVFGDPNAQSESVRNTLDRLKDVNTITMRYSAQMAASLRNIEGNIGGLTNLIIRTTGIQATGAGVNTGTNGAGDLFKSRVFQAMNSLGLSEVPVIGGIVKGAMNAVGNVVNALFGTKTSIIGQGITASAQQLSNIITDGFEAQYYTDIKKKKKFFGISAGTSYTTEYSAASAEVERQFQLIFQGFYDAIGAAAGPLGVSLDTVQGNLENFVVDIGKIDLKGLTGDQIQEKLTAVFGAAADNMARAALPMLEAFQQVGEGYFETIVRVSSGIEQATQYLNMLGVEAIAYTEILNTQGDVVAEIIRQSVILNDKSAGIAGGFVDIINAFNGTGDEMYQLVATLRGLQAQIAATGQQAEYMTTAMIAAAGGLEALQSGLSVYYDNFLSQEERNAAMLAQLAGQFAALGVAMPKTISGFRSLIEGIDITTLAGQEMYGALIALAPALYDYFNGIAAAQEAAAAAAEQAAAERQRAIEEAEDALRAAYDREADTMQKVIDQFGDLEKKLRDFAGSIFALTGAGKSLDQLRAEFASTATLAKLGNVEAMGNLPAIGNALKDAIVATATDRVSMMRELAMIANEALAAAGVAGNQKGIAEQQLDVLTAQVGELITLNETMLTVAQAIEALVELTGGNGGDNGGGKEEDEDEGNVRGPRNPRGPRGRNQQIAGNEARRATQVTEQEAANAAVMASVATMSAISEKMDVALYQIAKNTGETAKQLGRWDGDGLPDVRDWVAA